MAVGLGAVVTLLRIATGYLPRSFKHAIAGIRLIAWYIVTVSAYAKARGKCTRITAGGVKGFIGPPRK